MFVSWQDISCVWHRSSVTRNTSLFTLGGNLYAYTTDRRPLRARLASRQVLTREAYVGARLAAGAQSDFKVARVRHGGDWYLGQNYKLLESLASGPAAAVGLKPTVAEPTAPADLVSGGVQLAWLSGAKSVRLTEADQAALKTYLANGGLMLAEASMGDAGFAGEFHGLATAMGLKILPLTADSPILTGRLNGATGYALDTVKFKYALRLSRVGKATPELFGVYLGDKLVGIYSPFDLSYCRTGMDAFNCRGYETEDAEAIVTNILLWVSAR
jgi:hypothetical protein